MTRAIAGEEGLTGLEAPAVSQEISLQEQVVDWAGNNSGKAAGMIKGWVEEK